MDTNIHCSIYFLQMTQVRSFYMKKVKDLNEKLNAKSSLLEQIKTGRLKSDATSKRIVVFHFMFTLFFDLTEMMSVLTGIN